MLEVACFPAPLPPQPASNRSTIIAVNAAQDRNFRRLRALPNTSTPKTPDCAEIQKAKNLPPVAEPPSA